MNRLEKVLHELYLTHGLLIQNFGLPGRQEHHQMKFKGFTLQHDGDGN